VQFGNKQLSTSVANSWDLFVQDEWKLRGNLTLNLGVRYEYISPFSEINNHIVNLDLPVGFTSLPVPVQVGQSGPYNGQFPVTLVRPDRNNFAPRIGLAGSLCATPSSAPVWHQLQHGCVPEHRPEHGFSSRPSRPLRRILSRNHPTDVQNGISAGGSWLDNKQLWRRPQLSAGVCAIRNVDVQQQIRRR